MHLSFMRNGLYRKSPLVSLFLVFAMPVYSVGIPLKDIDVIQNIVVKYIEKKID